MLPDRYRKLILGDDTLLQTNHPDLFRDVALIIGHETTSEKGSFFNEIEFLSMKLTPVSNGIAPYYSNLDKMFASLQYTTGDTNEYFQKLCSFMNLLVFAPEGTKEKEWFDHIDKHARWLIKSGLLGLNTLACYKSKDQLIRNRSCVA